MDIQKLLGAHLRHFNKEKFFRMREYVITPSKITPKKLWYYYRVKKSEAFNNASIGTGLNFGTKFGSVPRFPHEIMGVVINHYSIIGKNCTIFHGVTIGNDDKDLKNTPIIGDNVLIGAGAKIIGKIRIGNNVKIGAGAIVTQDIPDNATVVMDKPRIIIREKQNNIEEADN